MGTERLAWALEDLCGQLAELAELKWRVAKLERQVARRRHGRPLSRLRGRGSSRPKVVQLTASKAGA
jgi:hypothetical protein